MSNGLYNKYRPKDFSELVGDIPDISNQLTKADHNHFFIFYGPSGVGKTTVANIMAKQIGAIPSETLSVNCASETGIDNVRKYMELTQYPPQGKAWVLLFNEVHKLTTAAQESLNDFLEFGLKNTYVIFTTTEPGKIIEALTTRAMVVNFPSIKSDDLFQMLRRINSAEGLGVSNTIMSEIADVAEGSARRAINLLEAVASMDSEKVSSFLEQSSDVGTIKELANAIIRGNWSACVSQIDTLEMPVDTIRRSVYAYLMAVIKRQDTPDQRLVKKIHYLSEIAPYGDKNWLLLQIAKGM